MLSSCGKSLPDVRKIEHHKCGIGAVNRLYLCFVKMLEKALGQYRLMLQTIEDCKGQCYDEVTETERC